MSQGHDAPSNVQPAMLRRSGRSRTNHNQFVPYMSKDVTEHATTYQLVKDILRDVFDWLARKASYLIDVTTNHFTDYYKLDGRRPSI